MKTKEYVIPCDKDIKQNAKITWSVLNLYIFSGIKGSSHDRATNLGHEYQKLIFIALLIAVMKIGRRIYDMNMIVPTTFISAVKFRNQQLRHFSDGYQQQKEIQIWWHLISSWDDPSEMQMRDSRIKANCHCNLLHKIGQKLHRLWVLR